MAAYSVMTLNEEDPQLVYLTMHVNTFYCYGYMAIRHMVKDPLR